MFTSIFARAALLRRDAMASLVVFLIALPLCMGIALASGAPISAGLIAGAAGGLIAGSLGGAPLVVTGPSAAQAVLIFSMVQTMGIGAVATATLLCGLLQLALSRLRVGRFVTMISPAVLQGMLAGIGVLIAAAQMTVVLGAAPRKNLWANLEVLPSLAHKLTFQSVAVAGLAFFILLVWPRIKSLARIPASLVAIVASTVLVMLGGFNVPRINLPEHVWHIGLPQMIPVAEWRTFLAAVISMTLIATSEALLSAVAVDKLHAGPRADLDRELLGQGLSNMVSGALGGLPVAGVIVRSSANIEAGAQGRASAILHGLWIIIAVSFFGVCINAIPLAALAALLVVVGLKPIQVQAIKRLYLQGELPVYVVTLVAVLATSLIEGIVLGSLFAMVRLSWRAGRGAIEVVDTETEAWQVKMSGAISFFSVPALLHALGKIPQGARVALDRRGVHMMDAAAREALQGWLEQHTQGGGEVILETETASPAPLA